MPKSKGFTQEDQRFISSQCNSIARLEKNGIKDSELRQLIYMLGVYSFRQYHKVGLPADHKFPGLQCPAKKWSPVLHKHIDERYIKIVEENVLEFA